MRRVSSLLLLFVIAINSLLINHMNVLAYQGDEVKEITLTLYSNLSSDQYISGIYYNDDFLVSCETICSLTGGKINYENSEVLEFSLSNGQRVFSINKNNNSIAEIFYSDSRKLDLSVSLVNEKVYLSALSFLDYIGATTLVLRDAPIQFWVFKHYDFFDAVSDYKSTVKKNFFWWDEVEADGDIKDRIINNGVIALINRDSNILRMIIDAEGIEREAIEDALVTILKNEGQAYASDEISAIDIIDLENRVIKRTGDAIEEAADAISKLIEKDTVFSKVLEGTESSASIAGDLSTGLNNYARVAETALQFASVSEAQRMVLQKTIIDRGESSYTLKTSWKKLRDAANNVNRSVQNEYNRNFGAASDFFYKEAYEVFNKAIEDNPVSIAWELNNDFLNIIPATSSIINNKTQLYNSYNASMIQLIANEILCEEYGDWYYSNMLCDESELDYAYEKMDSILYAMILQTKATMTARDYLIQSNYLESDYAQYMKEQVVELAVVLNKLENCKVSNIANRNNENTDLSWMSSYQSLSNDDLEQYLNNMKIPVDIYTYFHHYSDTQKVDINDPYTFWMMLSIYATMQMDDEMYPSGSRLAERYMDDKYGQMLILSEEEVRDAVNTMMPGITEYPPFPDIEYQKSYKKDGNYYFSLVDLDAGQATRMIDIEINDDGTATAIAEAYSHSYSENVDYVLETYQLNLIRNDKINLESPEPYPFCIESIKVALPEQIETESDGIAQAIWTEADTTLTFYYGPQVFVGDTFKGKTVTNAWSGSSVTDSGNESVVWADTVADSVTDVVFDASFWAVKPTSTHGWFQSFYELSRVDMSGLNTSSVTDMSNMFERCFSLTSLDLSGFDTSNVTNMSGMFAGSALTNLDLSSFDTSKVLDMSGMFHICSDLTNLNVSNFNTSKVTNMDSLFLACGNLTTLDVSDFDTSSVTNMREMFAECRQLTSLDVGGFDTSSVIVMQGMFRSCSNLLSIDVRGFNTSNVTDMYMMFCGCSSLTNIDLSNFDTSNVTTMGAMFDGCSSLTNLDVSSFSTSKVTGMESMFYGCSSLTSLNLNNFDTSNVTEMMHMFGECRSLTSLDLSGFNTFNVDNMYRMFGECDSLTSLDLSGFDVSKVTNIDDMFNSCYSLRTIYCEDSSTEWGLFEYSDNMFFGCESLIGKDGSSEIAFDDLKTDSSMAKAASLGGYFTPK